MSTIPSLALLPSGYKASKVYSVLPTNGDGDFTFSRTGNATRVNKDGLIETVGSNVPRLDYSDSNCPSLLLEPQRTNFNTNSENFNSYNILGGTINSNDIIAPDGSVNADTFVEDTSNSQHRIRKDISVSAGIYTMSVFVKGTGRYISLFPQGTSLAYAVFDIANENISIIGGSDYVDSKIENYGNGWYKCILIYNNTAGTNFLHIYLSNASYLASPTYTGNNSEISFFGLQLEEGSYPTSYIPTEGSTVTRNKDVCIDAGNTDLFNDNEGVVFLDVKITENSSEVKQTSLNNGTVNEAVKILQLNATTFRFEVTMSSGTNFSKDIIINPYQRNKLALQYKANDYKVFVNGIKQSVTQRSTLPLGLDRFNFNRAYSTSDDFTGKVNQLRIYNQALTDTELQQLTTL